MPAPPTPLDVAHTVVRNLVPLGGILFLGWSATNVLILYFVDTMLAMAVMFAGLARHLVPPPEHDEGVAAWLNAEAGYVIAALFIAAFMAVPLGMPLLFMGGATGVTLGALFADPSFRVGVALQAVAAFWSGLGLYRALRTHTPDELRLKRRFALIFLRWIAVMMVAYSGLVYLFGSFTPLVFVAVYAAASIVIDIAPDRFLRAMPGGGEDADPLPRSASSASPAFKQRLRRKRKH